MTDTLSPAARRAAMRAVRSDATTPEMRVRAAARRLKAGFRLGGWGLPGRPDLAFPGRRSVVFVHGCFWHGHDCRRGARMPKTNAGYWSAKIARNKARDAASLAALTAMGWRALIIWECESVDAVALDARLGTFLACE